MNHLPRSTRLLLLWTAIALLLSLTAKWMADAWLTERVPVIGDAVGLLPSVNHGIAFGIALPDIIELPIILIALIFVALLARKHIQSTINAIGFGMILGGAIANILDRLSDGTVTDFFQVGSFPIFNMADSCITIGAIFLLAESFGLVSNISKRER
jgi:signal peptidase II